MAPLVWLITGTSSGIGEQFVRALLDRGDRVIAASRNINKLPFDAHDNLRCLQIDVTAHQLEINLKAQEAIDFFGNVDVVVNNSGFYGKGVVEELDYDYLLDQFNVNFFGAVKVTQSFLPHFREQHSGGTFVFISSSSGWVGSPYCSPYCSSKFALEGLAESLASETARLGIRVLIVEPGYFRTSLIADSDAEYPPPRLPAYSPVATAITDIMKALPLKHDAGDPRKCADRVIDVVKSEGLAEGRPMPKRLVLGMDAVGMIREKCQGVLRDMDEWEAVSASTNFESTLPVRRRTLGKVERDKDKGSTRSPSRRKLTIGEDGRLRSPGRARREKADSGDDVASATANAGSAPILKSPLRSRKNLSDELQSPASKILEAQQMSFASPVSVKPGERLSINTAAAAALPGTGVVNGGQVGSEAPTNTAGEGAGGGVGVGVGVDGAGAEKPPPLLRRKTIVEEVDVISYIQGKF